ncbi:esterase [Actinoplanes ianthinogenes]|uniref:Esterase n=1 Tax=Actinoplanes ianthinogenes TaxID=122358 RepID=A0ABM7M827_9ACTN|nr:alpha/beta hydrolase-fold protein [Actinoplanes ianthinogenes]BCJ47784.1 esterase [Actinoplanes ianthinogenes]GGR04139.1 esterase [Actinoplanes ianthinogenes]
MSPDSLGTELLALAATVLAAALLSPLWTAARGRSRYAIRTAAVTACLLTATATGLAWVNRQVDTYPTWASLLGGNPAAAAPAENAAARGAGTGEVIATTVTGHASNLTLPMYVYLPPGYAEHPSTRYPVVEALHGYPGSPAQWLHRLHVETILNNEIDAGRMAPTVVLFPYQTPDPTRDTECTNLAGGPQTETFLTADVPAAARARFHVRTDAAGWGLVGYSAGGYCATDLLLRHPGQYAAGASLSGYATPGIPVGQGTENTVYNDLWRLAHLPIPAVSLYLSCARTDRAPLRDALALARAARAPLTVTTSYVGGGGHNAQTWQAMEAPAFDWLSTSLGRPVVPETGEPRVAAISSPAAGQ